MPFFCRHSRIAAKRLRPVPAAAGVWWRIRQWKWSRWIAPAALVVEAAVVAAATDEVPDEPPQADKPRQASTTIANTQRRQLPHGLDISPGYPPAEVRRRCALHGVRVLRRGTRRSCASNSSSADQLVRELSHVYFPNNAGSPPVPRGPASARAVASPSEPAREPARARRPAVPPPKRAPRPPPEPGFADADRFGLDPAIRPCTAGHDHGFPGMDAFDVGFDGLADRRCVRSLDLDRVAFAIGHIQGGARQVGDLSDRRAQAARARAARPEQTSRRARRLPAPVRRAAHPKRLPPRRARSAKREAKPDAPPRGRAWRSFGPSPQARRR